MKVSLELESVETQDMEDQIRQKVIWMLAEKFVEEKGEAILKKITAKSIIDAVYDDVAKKTKEEIAIG